MTLIDTKYILIRHAKCLLLQMPAVFIDEFIKTSHFLSTEHGTKRIEGRKEGSHKWSGQFKINNISGDLSNGKFCIK